MKKQMLSSIVILLLILSGCSAPDSGQDPDASTQSSFQEPKNGSSENTQNNTDFLTAFPRSQRLDYYMKGNLANYQVNTDIKTYKDNVFIKYPHLSGMTDTKLEESINTKLKNIALEHYEDTMAALEVECEIKLANSRIFSAYFYGYSNLSQSPHPNWIMFTINIDLETGDTLTFYDLYPQDTYPPHESWIDLISQQELFFLSDDGNEELSKAVAEMLHNEKDKYVLALTESLDIAGDYYSYLTKDSVGFCLYTFHAIGDYVRCEVPLENFIS